LLKREGLLETFHFSERDGNGMDDMGWNNPTFTSVLPYHLYLFDLYHLDELIFGGTAMNPSIQRAGWHGMKQPLTHVFPYYLLLRPGCLIPLRWMKHLGATVIYLFSERHYATLPFVSDPLGSSGTQSLRTLSIYPMPTGILQLDRTYCYHYHLFSLLPYRYSFLNKLPWDQFVDYLYVLIQKDKIRENKIRMPRQEQIQILIGKENKYGITGPNLPLRLPRLH